MKNEKTGPAMKDTKLENAYKAAEEKRRRTAQSAEDKRRHAAILGDRDTIPMDFSSPPPRLCASAGDQSSSSQPDTTNNEVAPTKTTMTPEEINKRIATACGWKTDKRSLGWLDPQGCYSEIPNYHGDLNAMHEAEEFLQGSKREYLTNLAIRKRWDEYEYYLSYRFGIRATAAQRAEAFLRTIGQWEEAE